MKKIYSLLIASAVAVSAAAPASAVSHNVSRKEKKNEVPAFPNQVSLAPMSQTFRQMRKADANHTLEGYWTMYFGDFYDDLNSQEGYIPVIFLATVDGSNVTFTPQMDSDRFYAFQGVFDAETSTLTLSKKMLGIQGAKYLFQVPFYYDFDNKEENIIDMEELVGNYDPADNAIYFEVDCGLTWGLYNNALGTDYDHDVAIFDINSGFQFNATASLEGEWEPIGNVTFEDPWLVPALGNSVSAADKIYDVPFEQSVENPYLFRLVNPYKVGPVAAWNGSEGGYIVFDISDQQHVIFLPADAGFYNTAILPGGISSFYCYNALGYEAVNQPLVSVEELIALYDYIPFTKYEDNKVILSKVTGNGETAYDANFGTQTNPFGGAFWNNVPMTGSITFPTWFNAEVGAIAVDESNAPVEYFNLNGVRVSNPEKGQIVIKRQGSKVSKVIL